VGQKVNPIGFRVGVTRDWESRWYSDKKSYPALLHEDLKIREYIKKSFTLFAGIARVEIERAADKVRVSIHTARPGVVIGRKGADVERLRQELSTLTGKQVYVNIVEIRRPELSAQLVAENVAMQLTKRVSFRRAMKRAIQATMNAGGLGIKIRTAGRLGGAELSRSEWYKEGRIPLHTLRADIDYGHAVARTTAGAIGVKCWLYRGEVPPGQMVGREISATGPSKA